MAKGRLWFPSSELYIIGFAILMFIMLHGGYKQAGKNPESNDETNQSCLLFWNVEQLVSIKGLPHDHVQ